MDASLSFTARARNSASVAQVVSLRPELEFEVIKLALLRENYLKRLSKTLSKTTAIDLTITGLFDVLREVIVHSDWISYCNTK